MWMGGIPPLGYRPDGRSLAIVPEQAALVVGIYRRYLAIGNVRLLAEALREEGLLAPERSTATGKTMGGRPFTRGQLYLMLGCRTYLGEISHHGEVFAGLHQAIVDRDLWDQVQVLLAQNWQGKRTGRNAREASLLAGLIQDEAGEPLIPVHATKGKVRYRYYVSRSLQQGDTDQGMRIPARELETAVTERLADAVEDPLQLAAETGIPFDSHDIPRLLAAAEQIRARIRQRERGALLEIVERVEVGGSSIALRCRGATVTAALGLASGGQAKDLILGSPVRLTRSGRALRLVHDSGATADARPDVSLIRLIARAHHWWRILRTEQVFIKTGAHREKVTASWMTRVLRLAFLSPAVIEAALGGRLRAGVDGAMLLTAGVLDAGWEAQERKLLCDR